VIDGTLHLSSIAQGFTDEGDGLRVRRSQVDDYVLPADCFLDSAGRRPRTQGLNLESLVSDMQGRAVWIDEPPRRPWRSAFIAFSQTVCSVGLSTTNASLKNLSAGRPR
jgi:hypothetical protein